MFIIINTNDHTFISIAVVCVCVILNKITIDHIENSLS